MVPMRQTHALLTICFLASGICVAQSVERPLFKSSSKDKLVHRMVFANGDYCQVREYGGEHIGMRIVYVLTERSASEDQVRSLIKRLAADYCWKKEIPLVNAAVEGFDPTKAKTPDHWMITLQRPNYAEFFISVDWLGESVVVQIKYYK